MLTAYNRVLRRLYECVFDVLQIVFRHFPQARTLAFGVAIERDDAVCSNRFCFAN